MQTRRDEADTGVRVSTASRVHGDGAVHGTRTLLFAAPIRSRGGVDKVALTLAAAAQSRGYRGVAAFPRMPETESLVLDFAAFGVPCLTVDIGEASGRGLVRRVRQIRPLVRMLGVLRRVRPDAVHLSLGWTTDGLGLLMACAITKTPTVVAFQLVHRQIDQSTPDRRLYAWFRRRKQKWVTPSDNNRRLLAGSFAADPSEISVVHTATGVREPSPEVPTCGDHGVRIDVRRELGLEDEAKLALTVARLAPQKGYRSLLPTVPHLVKERQDLHFVWVGDGPQRGEIEARLREYGVERRVHLLGHREDIPRLMGAADLFVFPTLYEGQPLVLSQAMSQKVPIVCSAASGIPEMLRNGVEAVLVRVGDSCDLLEGLRWALDHPSEMRAMAAAASERLREFGETRMIEETFAHLDSFFAVTDV
jgi:glycosyltransferase involved in cell wall biosynthesis